MRQVGAEAPIGWSSRYRVAVDACSVFEHLPACHNARVLNCELLLAANPRREVLRTIDRYAQKHLRMLGPAILRALAEKNSCVVRIHPHPVRMIGNKVCLARKLRNPETMVCVSRKQPQESWRRMTRVAYRNVQLVRSNDAELRIAKLPPVLMSNRGDLYSARRLWSILNRVDHHRGGQKQTDHNQHGNDRPCHLNLVASVDLGRVTVRIRVVRAKFKNRINQQSKNNNEYDSGNRQHEDR